MDICIDELILDLDFLFTFSDNNYNNRSLAYFRNITLFCRKCKHLVFLVNILHYY